MIILREFKVIHWEYNLPTDFSFSPIPESMLRSTILKNHDTNQTRGLKLRWILRLSTEKEQLMSYIAEDDYFFDFPQRVTLIDMRTIINASHYDYSEEFNKRKSPQALDFTKIYYPLSIDPEAILADLVGDS